MSTDYPRLDQGPLSVFAPYSDSQLQVSPGGQMTVLPPASAGSTGRTGTIEMDHPDLTLEERDSVLTHYAENHCRSFTVYLNARPGVSYTCVYMGRPAHKPITQTLDAFQVRVSLLVLNHTEASL